MFPGFRRDIREFARAVELVVIPSAQDRFSMITLEAMVMAKPVGATAIDGIVEHIHQEVEGVAGLSHEFRGAGPSNRETSRRPSDTRAVETGGRTECPANACGAQDGQRHKAGIYGTAGSKRKRVSFQAKGLVITLRCRNARTGVRTVGAFLVCGRVKGCRRARRIVFRAKARSRLRHLIVHPCWCRVRMVVY